MSHLSVRGEQSSDDEISALDSLAALAISGANQAIAKTSATTFSNVSVGGSISVRDGTTTVTSVDTIIFSGATVTDSGSGDVTVTITGGGTVDGSGTASEIAYWVDSDTLGSLTVATYPSLTELSYVKGVTSAIQTQINTKAPSTAPTFATSITGSYLTASEILITNASKNIISAAVATYPSLTELTYVKGVTSAIQTQIDGKQATLTNSAGLAAALSDETGSGFVVFSTSPQLTTSITTDSTTFALLNATATTVNAFGATTTLNIGASATLILNFGGSTTASEFRFLEPSASGTNYTAFKAVAQAASITYSLPSAVGGAGTFLTDAAGNGVLSWATPSGSGDVLKVGTPVDNQIGVWTGDGTIEGDADFLWSGTTMTATNTTDNASVQVAILQGDRATMADNDEAYITLRLSDDGGTQKEVARLTWVATDVNAATNVDGRIDLAVMTAGTLANELSLTGANLFPSTNDGLALGISGTAFADLFLASGGVIDFNAGNATITHSAGLLTSNVDVAVPDEAYGVGWNGSLEVPTKNAVYDKIETIVAGGATAWTDIGDASGDTTIALAGTKTTFTSTLDEAGSAVMVISNTDADLANDTTLLRLQYVDDADANAIFFQAVDDSAGTPNTVFQIGADGVITSDAGGTFAGALLPATDGGADLGSTTLAWDDLYLDTGATINFDNGNAVVTHSSGILTVSTGDLRVTTAGTNTASAVTVGGTQTLTSKTIDEAVISGTPDAAGELGRDTTQLALNYYDNGELGTVSRVVAAGRLNQSKINDVATDQDYTSFYTIPANSLFTSKVYRVSFVWQYVAGTSSATNLPYLKLGSTKVYTQSSANNFGDGLTRSNLQVFYIMGTAAAGASVNVDVGAVTNGTSGGGMTNSNSVSQPQALATNGTLAITFGITFSATGSTETSTVLSYVVEELN